PLVSEVRRADLRGKVNVEDPTLIGQYSRVRFTYRVSRPPATVAMSGRSCGVDLVEVTVAVATASTARPLPHQRVLGRARLASEEPRAGGRTRQAPAVRVVGQAAGKRLVRPLIGVRDLRGGTRAEDRGPDVGCRVHTGLEVRMRGQVGGVPVEHRAID